MIVGNIYFFSLFWFDRSLKYSRVNNSPITSIHSIFFFFNISHLDFSFYFVLHMSTNETLTTLNLANIRQKWNPAWLHHEGTFL